MASDLVEQLVPVLAVVVGAALTRVGGRSDARQKAAHELAELDRYVWKKGEASDWIDLQVFLGRLHVLLRCAGVPRRLVADISARVNTHWTALQPYDDDDFGESWTVAPGVNNEFVAAKGRVLDWLDRPWLVGRRWRAWNAAKPASAPEGAEASRIS